MPAKIATNSDSRPQDSASKAVPLADGAHCAWNTRKSLIALIIRIVPLNRCELFTFFYDGSFRVQIVIVSGFLWVPRAFPVSHIRVIIGPVSRGGSYRLISCMSNSWSHMIVYMYRGGRGSPGRSLALTMVIYTRRGNGPPVSLMTSSYQSIAPMLK